jgi:hypothetical protein
MTLLFCFGAYQSILESGINIVWSIVLSSCKPLAQLCMKFYEWEVLLWLQDYDIERRKKSEIVWVLSPLASLFIFLSSILW